MTHPSAPLVFTATAHPIYENARVRQFKLLMGGRLDESSRKQIAKAVADEKNKPNQKMRYALGLMLSMPEAQLS